MCWVRFRASKSSRFIHSQQGNPAAHISRVCSESLGEEPGRWRASVRSGGSNPSADWNILLFNQQQPPIPHLGPFGANTVIICKVIQRTKNKIEILL